jgi:hypothetical protein
MINKYLSVTLFLFLQLDLVLAGNKNCGRFVARPSTFNYKTLLLSLLSSAKKYCDLFARKMRGL